MRASQVVGDVIQNEQALQAMAAASVVAGATPEQPFEAAPAIMRIEKESSAKLLLIEDHETPLRGYRCFLALTDSVREEMGEFFLQPHRTSIVSGETEDAFYLPSPFG